MEWLAIIDSAGLLGGSYCVLACSKIKAKLQLV